MAEIVKMADEKVAKIMEERKMPAVQIELAPVPEEESASQTLTGNDDDVPDQ
jgi:hypothetical protein